MGALAECLLAIGRHDDDDTDETAAALVLAEVLILIRGALTAKPKKA